MQSLLVLLLGMTVWSSSSFAGLGGSVDALDSESHELDAKHVRLANKGNFSVHELSRSTSNVKEYATADGTVFAVTWRGAKRPDLSVLFGSYYEEYAAADAKLPKRMGRHPTEVKSSNIVVNRGGHMRDISGQAYVPSLVPAGFDLGSL